MNLTLMLSVSRSRALHWLEDHPEPTLPTLWESFVEALGSILTFGRSGPSLGPVESARSMMSRAWAMAMIQITDEIADEKGLTLQTFSRKDLPWWETALICRPKDES